MEALLQGGRAIDLVLAFTVLEGAVLYVVWTRTGRGLAPRAILSCLLPGACLMLALRAALVEASALVIAGWLLAALVSHLVDLALRWR